MKNALEVPLKPLFFLIIFFLASYLPLFLNGGIIVDDWGDIAHNLDCAGFSDCYQSWFPLFSNRPLAPLPITGATFLFGNHFSAYLVFNTAIFFFAIGLTTNIIRKLIGAYPALVFTIIAVLPTIAMPVIVSPINQLTATVSFLYWAISLSLLFNYCITKSKIAYLLSYLFLLFGFLTYEVILPLLPFTAFLPLIVEKSTLNKSFVRYFIFFILPILGILLLVILWQKTIAPLFMDVDSRLKFNASQVLAMLHTWAHVFYLQLPLLIKKVWGYLSVYDLATCIPLVLSLWFGHKISSPVSTNERQLKFLVIALLCFFSSSFIFILSGESATSWGYGARGLSSTWFVFALTLAGICGLIKKYNAALLLVVLFFSVASSLTFSVQRDNYIKSWQLQTAIIQDILNLAQTHSLNQGTVILGDVPKFLTPNYNDEIVFSQPWDFGAALAIHTNKMISDGATIDTQRNDLNKLLITENGILISGWWRANFDDLWLYAFDPTLQKGSLTRLKNADQLKAYLNKPFRTQ